MIYQPWLGKYGREVSGRFIWLPTVIENKRATKLKKKVRDNNNSQPSRPRRSRPPRQKSIGIVNEHRSATRAALIETFIRVTTPELDREKKQTLRPEQNSRYTFVRR